MEERKLEVVPRHVAAIMDGNGRWAKARGLPRLAGHRAGTENLRPILEACAEFGIESLTIWAFSTENWRRPETEVMGLLRILERMIQRELNELHKQGVQLRHIGRLERLPRRLQQQVLDAIDTTKDNDRITLISDKASAQGLELIFDVDQEMPRALKGDALRIGQVLIEGG